MPLNIEKYTKKVNIWPMLRQYVMDYFSFAGQSSEPDDISVLKLIKNMAHENLQPHNEYATFKKGIENLYNKKTATLKRENIYRLCYALGLDSDRKAQDLCLDYLHENELSPRSLNEFIIICGLRLHLKWETVLDLRSKYNERLHNDPVAPVRLVQGTTRALYTKVICASIQTVNDLDNWLAHEPNLAYFAKTRNTQYFALFNDMDWSTYSSRDFSNAVPTLDTTIKLYHSCLECTTVTMQDYYLSLFGLHSIDDVSVDTNEYLSSDEIASLSKTFPNVFMTYDTFCNLIQRKRPTDISSGTYTLRMLEEMDPSDPDNPDYVMFNDKEDFIAGCNAFLNFAGLPSFNRYSAFDSLILDVYQETLTENPTASNMATKALFFSKLRRYLKDIAAYNQS